MKDNRKLILVIDDSLITRKLFSKNLFNQGYNIITAADGAEAIEVMEFCTPDAVFLDLRMPKIHGLKLFQWIRSKDELKHLPVFIISSFTESDQIADTVKQYSVQGWFQKPFDFKGIIDALHKFLP